MDYRIVEDLTILSRESVINEYNVLCRHYNEIKASEQRQLQEIHQLKRELKTATNDKDHLTSELDIINAEHVKEMEEVRDKHSIEVQQYKDRLVKCEKELEAIESERDSLETLVNDLKKEVAEDKEANANVPAYNNQSMCSEKIAALEMENDELAEVVAGLKAELTEALKSNLQLENKIEDLMDRLHCAEENLNMKRQEVEEKNEMYETAQERVIELSGELNALRMESDAPAKRGNSLFAEVDDQRQKMRALLVAQKANYIEMKNELENSQQEIRKLKRENTAMYKEMEVCSHIFLNAEQHHTEKLNERIAELMNENDAISKKLSFTEKCLNEMINENDVKWLDPMIAICKNESNDLKDRLYRCSLQKVTIAGTLREREEESARWRFEALKSRCIIADREALLEDNNIPFGAVSNIDRRIRKMDNEFLSPNIACRPSMLGFKRRSLNKVQSPRTNVLATPTLNNDNEPAVNTHVVHNPIVNTIDKIGEVVVTSTDNISSSIAVDISSESAITNPVVSCKDEKELESIFKKPSEPSKPLPQSADFTGVTIRKKPSHSSTSALASKLRSPRTVLNNPSPTPLQNKLKATGQTNQKPIFQKSSAPILKPSTNGNIPAEKKVKFDDALSMANSNEEKLRTEQNLEKTENVPKTAIKKRIFIASKKPTK